MRADKIAVIDVETTGLDAWRHDRIVEIAVVVVSPDGSVLREYDTLVNPGRDIGPTSKHGITAGDVAKAPAFAEIAGDLLNVLSDSTVVSGHNVSFDKRFIVKEYERIGVVLPEFPSFCTLRHLGRGSLESCCKNLGIAIDGALHRALTDARATARIVTSLLAENQEIISEYRLGGIAWPLVGRKGTPCHRREHAASARQETPRFLKVLAERIRHDTEGTLPDVLAYMTLLDRVLEDRTIDGSEENLLIDAATSWQLSAVQVAMTHTQYLHNLAVAALADGIITDSERRDLHLVAQLLGLKSSDIDSMLEKANLQLSKTRKVPASQTRCEGLKGKRVCFTGELQSTLAGQPITREFAEALAQGAGLIPVTTVTKSLDILVVADPNTQSGKAKKARDYGVRVLSDSVFWRMVEINVD